MIQIMFDKFKEYFILAFHEKSIGFNKWAIPNF